MGRCTQARLSARSIWKPGAPACRLCLSLSLSVCLCLGCAPSTLVHSRPRSPAPSQPLFLAQSLRLYQPLQVSKPAARALLLPYVNGGGLRLLYTILLESAKPEMCAVRPQSIISNDHTLLSRRLLWSIPLESA
jgi:hypothetical protein